MRRYALADAFLTSPKRPPVESLPEARMVLRSAAVRRNGGGAPQRITQALVFLRRPTLKTDVSHSRYRQPFPAPVTHHRYAPPLHITVTYTRCIQPLHTAVTHTRCLQPLPETVTHSRSTQPFHTAVMFRRYTQALAFLRTQPAVERLPSGSLSTGGVTAAMGCLVCRHVSTPRDSAFG